MNMTPTPGQIIALETGDATILDMRYRHGSIIVLAYRDHPMHPFVTWLWDDGNLYSGNYYRTLDEAETNLEER